MHIGVPFDIETVRQSWGQAGRMWGRVVANHDFLTALAAADFCRHLTLFVPARRDVELLEGTLVAGFGAHRSKAFVVPFAQLSAHLAAQPVDVMHVLDPNLWFAAHVRSQLSRHPFVISGVTHSLGTQQFLDWALLNSANGVLVDDCLVCTTPTAQAVVESAFARLRTAVPGFRAPATTVIPFGVSSVPAQASHTQCRAQLRLDPQTVMVLSLARFNPNFKMDLRPVLRLASLVLERAGGPLQFVLAGSSGDGEYLRYIREQARAAGLDGPVVFAPDPDESEKARLLTAADVFLSLSDNLQETFGLTVVEAMAAGLPVVASDWDGYRSLLEDGVSGYLVPTKGLAPDAAWEAALALRYDSLVHLFSAQTTAVDLEVAAERLLALAADAGLRQRMGAVAAQRSRAFAWPAVIARYAALWRRMLGARDRARAAGGGEGGTPASSALRFVADFAGYASSRLDPTDRFGTTAAGRVLLQAGLPIRFYYECDEILDFAVMREILRRCAQGRTVAELGAAMQAGEAVSELRLGQNLLWLYKYGYLRLL